MINYLILNIDILDTLDIILYILYIILYILLYFILVYNIFLYIWGLI